MKNVKKKKKFYIRISVKCKSIASGFMPNTQAK